MDADRAFDIIVSLDDASRALSDIRIFRHGHGLREEIARQRDALNAVRRQLDAARAAP